MATMIKRKITAEVRRWRLLFATSVESETCLESLGTSENSFVRHGVRVLCRRRWSDSVSGLIAQSSQWMNGEIEVNWPRWTAFMNQLLLLDRLQHSNATFHTVTNSQCLC